MGRLEGKIVLITGAARGMGASHARAFVEEGAKVAITDILEKEGKYEAAELGEKAIFVRHDVTKESDWEEAVKQTEAAFGPINVLINNAGVTRSIPTVDQSVESYNQVYQINQLSVFLGMKAVFPSMQKAEKGSIINVSSISGIVGQAASLAYNATKFAVRGMTKSAAVEWGPLNIRVNSIHPGIIRTPMNEAAELQDILEKTEAGIPLQRPGDSWEITPLCIFLASDESSYCTGSEFIIDGGFTAQ
ncbi:SDR family NAD(P)-dependent oxidoreductase [Alkalicoccus halolimnae]|uniref:Glucose 1-dehydrogenase n=1 Tax=Alkalicoccus halolimnae TaxID=1667239 RepID=A0A5C7F4H9_9BACI|nr:glucose 1-dehydrogenase [Alkalicoccus halolimnae]TXF84664.1 glucose 1-dehydrogenase [Alkalicoccus halolimnae]